ncbi:MAG: DUF6268 family outer membrane beta-barrel protein [Chloroherpetonaceae bacterium]|nr:DUF6268 family outer membrane beta-barrel protein [Chloroherpetonaceae bacterium]MCS7211264.1 DUF6268 family outer membrane beta-barrel protein [Chloroherpetonaceae bacterium]MDW8019684.1 DUF6268 family outer membrane beta-barrel protein [Chloroherpetonaceae bacterium]MDW8465238.1 DUF6268 family outer membrane beta-barrel protein [Chloroherpetonaceae bacterium]
MRLFLYQLLTFSLCFVISAPLYAQREQLGIRYEQFGVVNLDRAEPSLAGNSFSASALSLNASFKVFLDKRGASSLTVGAQYRFVSIAQSINVRPSNNPGPSVPAPREAHLLYLDLVWQQRLSTDFTLLVAARPGIFSDFRNIVFDHTRLEGAAFVDWRLSDELTLGLGASRTSNFGRVLIVPILHIIYFGGELFMIDAIIPRNLDFIFYPSKEWEIGLSILLNGSEYRVGDAALNNLNMNQFGFANLTVGPIVRYQFLEKTYLSLEGGYTVLRRTELADYRLSGDARFLVQFNPANTWFIRAGFQVMY